MRNESAPGSQTREDNAVLTEDGISRLQMENPLAVTDDGRS